ncbi:MAG: hypothetical protein KY458_06575, partial [Actinobacteria bacterium]|nr:hypothetical protein [Actinomycetota bacterium]
GPGQGGDYVGLPLGPGQGGDDVGAGVMGVGVPLPPRGAELGRGARRADRGAVAPARPDGEERPVQGLPVSTTDVVLLGGLVIAGLALAARRAHSLR